MLTAKNSLLLSLVLAVLAALIWLSTDASRSGHERPLRQGSAQTHSRDSSSPSQLAPQTDQDPVHAEPHLTTSTETSRSDTPANRATIGNKRILDGVVLDTLGQAVADATVSWTPQRLITAGAVAPTFDLDSWEDESAVTVSSQTGQFQLDLSTKTGSGVLWLTKPGYLAQWRLVPGGRLTSTATFEFEPAPSILVRVIDVAGKAVAGASIEARGISTTGYPRDNPQLEDAKQLLWRSSVSDPSGRAGLPAYPGYARVQAQAGTSQSTPAVLEPGSGETALVLGETWQFDASINGLEADQSAYCAIYFQSETATELLDVLPVLNGSSIDPTAVAKRDSGLYQFQLEGPDLAPCVVLVPTSEVGTKRHVKFDVAEGYELPLLFTDPDEVPLAGVRVRVHWAEGQHAYSSAGNRLTDQDGRLDLLCPVAAISISYAHPDYAAGSLNDILIQSQIDEPVVIQLQPSGGLSGVVLFDGERVPSYRLHYWPSGDLGSLETVEIGPSTEGRFSVENVPVGGLELFALAPGLPQSQIEFTSIRRGETTEVELHIPDQGIGTGKVVDAATGQPLAGCNVDRYLHDPNGQGLTLAFEEHRTGVDGRFSFPGFGAKLEQIWVTESEHAGAVAQSSRGSNGRYDFGVIRLDRTSTLTLQFEGKEDLTGYAYQVTGAHNTGPHPIPTSRLAALEGTLPNSGSVYVITPEGDQLSFGFLLVTNGPWTLPITIGGLGRLSITISGAEPDQLEGAWLQIQPDSVASIERREAIYINSLDAQLELHDLPLGKLVLKLRGSDGSTLASTIVDCDEDGESVSLRVNTTSKALRIVDTQGLPLAGISWTCFLPGSSRSSASGRSDEMGICRVGGIEQDSIELVLKSSSGGVSTGIAAHLGPLDRPTEVVFDPSASLELAATDREVPLDGVMLSIRDATTGDFLGWPTTDANGKATFGNVTEGEVLISPHATSIWYETVTVRTSTTPTLETLEFRRIGSLTVTVLNAYGKPEVGAFVAITSDEYDTDVAEWLSEQRVTSAGGLVTDDAGQVHIEGLPNGAYAIYVRGESGAAVVPPLGEEKIAIKLPPK